MCRESEYHRFGGFFLESIHVMKIFRTRGHEVFCSGLILPGIWGMVFLLSASTFAAPPELAVQRISFDSLSLVDIDGKVHHPFEHQKQKALVLVFISTDCPIANYYHPTLRKLDERWDDAEVQMLYLHCDSDVTVAQARKHAKEFGITVPVILDKGQAVARKVHAEKTPEAVVITREGVIAYRGRIDNTYARYGKKRPRPTQNDLADAVQSVLAGEPVKHRETESVGCYISFDE